MPWGAEGQLPPIPGDEPQNQPPLPQGQSLADILGQHQAFYDKAREENTTQPFELTSELGPDGKMKYNFGNVDENLVKTIFQDLKWKNDTMAEMQKEVSRIESQRKSGNAIMDVLATVGGELAASDPRLPPVVSALGRASLRLNPTQQELTDRKIGLMQAMGQMSDQSLQSAEGMERLRLSDQKTQLADEDRDLAREAKILEGFNKRTDLLANKAGTPLTFAEYKARARQFGLKREDTLADGYQAYVAATESARSAKEAEAAREVSTGTKLIEERGEEARATEAVKARNRYMLADHNRETGLEAKKAYADYSYAITQDKALTMVPARDKKDLIGLRETERYIDGISELLDDPQFADLMGAEKLGRYATRRLQSEQRVKLENYLKHETPRILNLVLRGGQGGASILRTEEGKKMVRDLGVMTDLNVAGARQIIGNLKKVTSDGRKSIMDATPKAPWGEYPDLTGADASYRPRTGPGRQAAAAPAAGGETPTRRQNPQTKEWWVFNGDAWVKE